MGPYDYVYVVVCFAGFWNGEDLSFFLDRSKRLRSTLPVHFRFLNEYPYLKDKSVLLVLAQRGGGIQTEKELAAFAEPQVPDNVDVRVLRRPNREMTTGALWDVYKWLEYHKVEYNRVAVLDDDYLFGHWKQREELLDSGFGYIGMFEIMKPKSFMYSEYWRTGHKFQPGDPMDQPTIDLLRELNATGSIRRWTDGGYYLTDRTKLCEMEKRIGKFNKAPGGEITSFSGYCTHGVTYGEVGFPTSLWANGIRFTVYQDHSYISKPLGIWRDFSQILITAPAFRPIPNEFFVDEYTPDETWVKLHPGRPFPPEFRHSKDPG